MSTAFADRLSPVTRSCGRPWRVRLCRLVVVSAVAALVVPVLGPSAALAHPPGTTQRVSVSSTGTAGDDFSVLAAVSADGRFVAFWSFASTLVPGDTCRPRADGHRHGSNTGEGTSRGKSGQCHGHRLRRRQSRSQCANRPEALHRGQAGVGRGLQRRSTPGFWTIRSGA